MFEEIKAGKYEQYTSEYVTNELAKAPTPLFGTRHLHGQIRNVATPMPDAGLRLALNTCLLDYRAVDAAMVETYWRMGRRIVEEEQQGKARAGYGEALMVRLSRYLDKNFGKGFL